MHSMECCKEETGTASTIMCCTLPGVVNIVSFWNYIKLTVMVLWVWGCTSDIFPVEWQAFHAKVNFLCVWSLSTVLIFDIHVRDSMFSEVHLLLWLPQTKSNMLQLAGTVALEKQARFTMAWKLQKRPQERLVPLFQCKRLQPVKHRNKGGNHAPEEDVIL